MTGRKRSSKAQQLLDSLLANEVPLAWRGGELQQAVESMNLYDFLKGFLVRHEYLNTVINATGKKTK